jgi:hypothetical protein
LDQYEYNGQADKHDLKDPHGIENFTLKPPQKSLTTSVG